MLLQRLKALNHCCLGRRVSSNPPAVQSPSSVGNTDWLFHGALLLMVPMTSRSGPGLIKPVLSHLDLHPKPVNCRLPLVWVASLFKAFFVFVSLFRVWGKLSDPGFPLPFSDGVGALLHLPFFLGLRLSQQPPDFCFQGLFLLCVILYYCSHSLYLSSLFSPNSWVFILLGYAARCHLSSQVPPQHSSSLRVARGHCRTPCGNLTGELSLYPSSSPTWADQTTSVH